MKNVLNQICRVIVPIFKGCSTILGAILDICFLVAILYGLFYIPMIGSYKPVVVQNNNNELSYEKGTLLYYKNVSAKEIDEDDIILYKPGTEYIIHRVNRVLKVNSNNKDNSELANESLGLSNSNQESFDTSNNDNQALSDDTHQTNSSDLGEDNSDSLNEDDTNFVYYYETEPDSYHSSTPNRIEYKDVLGEVSKVSIPYLGYYVQFINNHMHLFRIMLGILVINFFISFFHFSDNKN